MLNNIMRIWYEYKLTIIYDELVEYCYKFNLDIFRLKNTASRQTVKLIDKYNKYAQLCLSSGSTYLFSIYPKEL